MTEAAENMTFPLLGAADIIGCLAEINIPITKEDLKTPQVRINALLMLMNHASQPNVIRGVLETLAEVVMGVKAEDLKQVCRRVL
jgi:hypothetical protein